MGEIEDNQCQVVNIYSNVRDAKSDSDSDFYTTLNITQSRGYDKICVLQAAIPTSYYIIATPNNVFTYKEDSDVHTITVTPGNYNSDSLISVLITLLEAASNHSAQFSITYPDSSTQPDTGKFTYTVVSGSATTYQFIFGSSTGINIQMGFTKNTTNTFSVGVLTSTNVINMKINKFVRITCDKISDSASNILQDIPNQFFGSMGIIAYQATILEAGSKSLIRNELTYRFTLRDEADQLIDLNGQSWAFSLLFYKQSTFKKLSLEKLTNIEEKIKKINNK